MESLAAAAANAVYPALLGSAWAKLAAPVKNLHAAHVSATGRFRVRRGTSALARMIAAICGMPAAGDDVSVALAVTRTDAEETWSRSFAGRPLLTRQWMARGLLVEALGLVLCVFRLRVDGRALVFDQVGASFGGRRFSIPMPRLLAPRIEGRAVDEGDRVHVHVRISAPLAGLLVSYEGLVTTEARATAPKERA